MEQSVLLLLESAVIVLLVAGFSVMEAGYTRAKNSGDVIMRCIMGFGISIVTFFFVGKLLLAGSTYDGGDLMEKALMSAIVVSVFSGALAGRMKFSVYLEACVFLAAVIYPIGLKILQSFHLSDSLLLVQICTMGGITAFFGAKILGPRLGKYSKGGISKAIPGHNIPLGAQGTMLILFCWILLILIPAASRGKSGIPMESQAQSLLISTCISGIISFAFTWIRYKKTDITLVLNGFLAGMVAGSAGGGDLSLIGSVLLGIFVGFIVILFIEYTDKSLKIDDPVGSSAVFGMGGVLGIVGKGLFSTGDGLFYGGDLPTFGKLLICTIALLLWSSLAIIVFMGILKKIMNIRVSSEDELEGLDLSEHGLVSSYYDFTYNIHTSDYSDAYFLDKTNDGRKDTLLRKEDYRYPQDMADSGVLTKIEIITRKEKFENLKIALNDIGITGMTVTPVSGYGVQKGYNEFYRGVPMDVQLRAKIRIEIVIAKVPVEEVVNTARKILYTGYIGDGKIFIYSLNDVIRVRTGEHGFDALQVKSGE